jgi:glycosyltransferase involved in cell wall biosynthesis
MKKRKPKIFHGLVNYGTQSGLFARELRCLGYDAISVTRPDSFKRVTDIEILQSRSNFDRIKKLLFLLSCFFKYNIFHFYYGTSLLPKQIDLPFYKMFGKKVVFHYLGNDVMTCLKSIEIHTYPFMQFLVNKKEMIKYDAEIVMNLTRQNKYANLALVCLPTYLDFVKNSKLLNLGIDLDNYLTSDISLDYITICHAPTDRRIKGTSHILDAIDRLKKEGYNLRFNLIENTEHFRLREEIIKCTIFIDHVIGTFYGTVGIEAMALGRPVFCVMDEMVLKNISYSSEIPVVNTNPGNVYENLKYYIENSHFLLELSKKSRIYVEKYHDIKKQTKELVNIYSQL